MIDVHIFDLTKCAAFYVVSTPEVISDLCFFTDHHYANGDLNAEALFERILFHDAYCCILPKSLTGRLIAQKFKRVLKKRDRLIDIDFYFEAFILADPEGAGDPSLPVGRRSRAPRPLLLGALTPGAARLPFPTTQKAGTA